MSAVAESVLETAAGDRLARRNAVVLAVTQALAGKAFLWGLGALGAEGPGHVIDLMIDEMKSATGQLGALRLDDLRKLDIRHESAIRFEPR
jgi:(S)-mandelate dehydrogenase